MIIFLYNSPRWPELVVFLLYLVFEPEILRTNVCDFCFCLFTNSMPLLLVNLYLNANKEKYVYVVKKKINKDWVWWCPNVISTWETEAAVG